MSNQYKFNLILIDMLIETFPFTWESPYWILLS